MHSAKSRAVRWSVTFTVRHGRVRVKEDEHVDRAIAAIFVVVASGPSWRGRDGLACFADELRRAFVETHHRPLGIGRLGVDIEHVLHASDIGAIDLWGCTTCLDATASAHSPPGAGAPSRATVPCAR